MWVTAGVCVFGYCLSQLYFALACKRRTMAGAPIEETMRILRTSDFHNTQHMTIRNTDKS